MVSRIMWRFSWDPVGEDLYFGIQPLTSRALVSRTFDDLFIMSHCVIIKVICARGKAAKDHPGNQWFRSLVEEHIQEYAVCESKLEKSFVVSKVLKRVRQASPHGGFVKSLKGKYWEVGDRLSREKIGQVCALQPEQPTRVEIMCWRKCAHVCLLHS